MDVFNSDEFACGFTLLVMFIAVTIGWWCYGKEISVKKKFFKIFAIVYIGILAIGFVITGFNADIIPISTMEIIYLSLAKNYIVKIESGRKSFDLICSLALALSIVYIGILMYSMFDLSKELSELVNKIGYGLSLIIGIVQWFDLDDKPFHIPLIKHKTI